MVGAPALVAVAGQAPHRHAGAAHDEADGVGEAERHGRREAEELRERADRLRELRQAAA